MGAASEEQAMRSFMVAQKETDRVACMTDTYDWKLGAQRFLKILKDLGIRKTYLQVDSGDKLKIARYYRKLLDSNGFRDSYISAAGNLNEYNIEKLCKKQAPIDLYLVVTEGVTSSDSPVIDFVYKIAQVRKSSGATIPCGKLSEGKISFPGDKQVMRRLKKGKFHHDVLCLARDERRYKKAGFKPMLKHYVKRGKVIRKIPDVWQARRTFMQQCKQLPQNLKNLGKSKPYKVIFDTHLYKLLDQLRERHS
jgi:nicotinate phosphoribosyltransferase